MKYILDEKSDFVECQICGEKRKIINGRHLKKHKITLDEYFVKFPNAPTITKEGLENEQRLIEKRRQGRTASKDKTRIVNCYFCGKEIEVKIGTSIKYSRCKDCKDKGLTTPAGQASYDGMRKTMKKIHNVDNPSELKFVNEKQSTSNKKTYKERGEEINNKKVETKVERYGEDWAHVLNERSEEGMLRIHGKKKALKIDKFLNKQQNTMEERYDVTNAMQIEVFKNKQQEAIIESLDVINSMQSDIVKEKVKATNLNRLGVEWPMQSKIVQEKAAKTYMKKFIPKMLKFLEFINLELLDPEYIDAGYDHKFKCKKCGNELTTCWNYIQQGKKCPVCYPRTPKYTSKGENEVKEFVRSLGFNIIENDRSFIYPFEIDIRIPDRKIAIEYDGLFYHTEDKHKDIKHCEKPSLYHVNKLKMCSEKDYRLITIFEDEWIYKKEIVLSRISRALDINSNNRIHGRNCIIKEINSSIKNDFLDKYHLQGKDNSTIKLGAFYNNELVSVMTFSYGNPAKGSRKEEGVWELNRFCSNYNYHIPGIASKLLEHFKRNYEWKRIFSYADLRWSTGKLYERIGFTTDGKLPENRLNYWYVKNMNRIHRFQLRKRQDEPKDIPEHLLRLAEGYYRIWDCGNLKFVLEK